MSDNNRSERVICVMRKYFMISGGYRTLVLIALITVFLSGCTKDENPDLSNNEMLFVAGLNEVLPANLAEGVEVNPVVCAIFKSGTDASVLSGSILTLKEGQVAVPGKTTISGTTAIFIPESDLIPETEYRATLKTGHKTGDAESENHEYSWKFKTGTHRHNNTLKVMATYPANKATAVSVTTQLNVTFNAELTSAMKNADLIVLKNGQSIVGGTLSYSGSVATFKPSENLSPNTFYDVKVKLVVSSNNNDSYDWSFTTGGNSTDVRPPTITSVVPANNDASAEAGSTVKVIFSETMDPGTINAANILLEKGTEAIAGTVSYSGVTATFTPSAALAANNLYTATVTTAVKDAAGNPMEISYKWSFTTKATIALISFASEVAPVLLQCDNCHNHPWTTSSNASTFYSNLVSGGYVNTVTPLNSRIYSKLNGGHPGSGISTTDINKILNWFTQGAHNN
jgi:hypothetical protein